MKRVVIVAVAALIALASFAKGILPVMVYRRGLTNEQIDGILAAHPDAQLRMTAQDWRAMRYQLFRFENMTNYVEQIAGTNDAARVLLQLTDERDGFAATNRTLSAALQTATDRANEYADAYAGATNRLAEIIFDYTSATNRAARLDNLRTYLVEQRDAAKLPTTKAIYQALIDRIDAKED